MDVGFGKATVSEIGMRDAVCEACGENGDSSALADRSQSRGLVYEDTTTGERLHWECRAASRR